MIADGILFKITSTSLDNLIQLYKAAPQKLSVNLSATVEQALIIVDKQVVQAFKSGGPGWTPISRKWRDWKGQNFFSTKILIMTGMLSGSITHRKTSRHTGRVYIRNGVYPHLKKHFPAGSKMRKKMAGLSRPTRTVQQVGYWHETGEGQNTARPFFATTASWFNPQFRLMVSAAIKESLR